MDYKSRDAKMDDLLKLHPGYRFHPTDEELIVHFLLKKVLDSSFFDVAIGEVDMNKFPPWELPWIAKVGEKKWYFFCVNDKKYSKGLKINRVTAQGQWRSTGSEMEIFMGKALVGKKRTLIFYRGRAAQYERTNWISHEYRLEGIYSPENLPKEAKNDLVIWKVYQRSRGTKKVHISEMMRMDNSSGNDKLEILTPPSFMDPIMNEGKERELVRVSQGRAMKTENSSGLLILETVIGKLLGEEDTKEEAWPKDLNEFGATQS